jgi:N-acetyl-gamma-glutamyl-phosphate reductase
MPSVGVVGASGFAGAELLRLLASHPELDLSVATGDTQAGMSLRELYPSLTAAYGDRVFAPYSPDAVDGLDVAFLAMPHGVSQSMVPELLGRVKHVVDVAADFRLNDPSLYPQWYGEPHTAPELLSIFAYGLPELFRDDILGAAHVAAAGCYPTTATLPLAPLARAGLIEATGIIVDAASGVSGDPAQVLFTPHLAPMNRGILATCYARSTGTTTTAQLLDCLHSAYDSEPFVVVTDGSPSTKATLGANVAHTTAHYDARTGWVLALCALDNLVKGTSGQAIQCANLLLGLDETLGLPTVGVYP